jgi:crossover junction endodeoxyribonuclease RusA
MKPLSLPWPYPELSPNARVHWSKKSSAVAKYRGDCFFLARAAGWDKYLGQRLALEAAARGTSLLLRLDFLPRTVRGRDDDNNNNNNNNLVPGFKAGCDGVAQALGLNDSLFATLPLILPVPDEAARRGTVELRIEVMK